MGSPALKEAAHNYSLPGCNAGRELCEGEAVSFHLQQLQPFLRCHYPNWAERERDGAVLRLKICNAKWQSKLFCTALHSGTNNSQRPQPVTTFLKLSQLARCFPVPKKGTTPSNLYTKISCNLAAIPKFKWYQHSISYRYRSTFVKQTDNTSKRR